ncbi:MAG TPA: succinyl-diaminopimelate desuccinylase [Acidimicrobiales bacterium]|nr:succinyl-diaminopimelate desuccinylase [Acidimicrobiales bacterium]
MTSRDLLAATAELVAVPSPSRGESALADQVEAALRGCPSLAVSRVGDNVVGRTDLGRPHRVTVAGHLDTVAPAGNEVPRVDGDTLYGLGAADMKGSLAVMLDLARALERPAVDVNWCFYACEEAPRSDNGLGFLWEARPELVACDAAVLAEPTACLVEAGCQGTMRVAVRAGGTRAHTARPFTGLNAIHRLGPVLDRVVAWEGRSVLLDGCRFTEQLQAVFIEGGVAGNVVPDQATLTLNYRFAPDRDALGAEGFLRALLDGTVGEVPGDELVVLDVAEGAPPALDHPLLAELVRASGRPPRAKVGWTDVATFWAHGVPAANFGPGDPLLAHRSDEHVDRASLERARAVLYELLGGSSGQDGAERSSARAGRGGNGGQVPGVAASGA